MNSFRTLVGVMALLAVLGACSSSSEPSKTSFTLSTGVSLDSGNGCLNDDQVAAPVLEKRANDYVLKLQDFVDCNSKPSDAYLTESRDKKVTLVFGRRSPGGLFKSNCECSQRLTFTISDRLEPGDTLYVLDDDHVLGHLLVP
jgi:hypothetical protein